MVTARIERSWIYSESAGILLLGILTLARGVSYLPAFANSEREPAHWLEGLIPVDWWAWVWLAVGGLAVASTVLRKLISATFGMSIAIHMGWALSFFAATLTGITDRGWVSGISYIGLVLFALFAFGRGQREEIRISGEV